jgi:dihydropteroate synthase
VSSRHEDPAAAGSSRAEGRERRRANPAVSAGSRPRACLGGVEVGAARPVAVMGVLNVSPESFHAGSVVRTREALLRTAERMVAAGAALLDVGARSTAPYLETAISEEEEAARLAPAVDALVRHVPVPVSADTARPVPARAALEAGARVINDVSGLRDPAVAALVGRHRASVILMAAPPVPLAAAADAVAVVRDLLGAALRRAAAAGIPEDRVVVDPGIGFFRQGPVPWPEWDIQVLNGLGTLAALGRPLCIGVSRKSFLGALTGRSDPADRLPASLAATAVAVLFGAAVIRTHDVEATVDAVRVAERFRLG